MGLSDAGIAAPPPESPKKPVDMWLVLLSAALALVLFLIPKTPLTITVALCAIFALLAHPLWNSKWVELTAWRRASVFAILAASLAWMGFAVWPKPDEIVLQVGDITILHHLEGKRERLFATIAYTNPSSFRLETRVAMGSYFVSANPALQDAAMERARREAERVYAASPPIPSEIGPHESRGIPFTGPAVSRAEYRDFRAGHYRFYVAGFIDVEGEGAKGRTTFCGFSQGVHDQIFICPKRGAATNGRFP
ncbi:MAG: hypothetical protein JO282_10695 [Alphaproteobacteria bacterium]|nr:hypothetical protein [Alphaproteobacteria bacterium]